MILSAIRRGIGLGLAMTGLWLFSLTTEVRARPAPGKEEGDGSMETGLLKRMVGPISMQTSIQTYAGKMFLYSAPVLLRQSEELRGDLQEEPAVLPPAPVPAEPDLPDHDDRTKPDLEQPQAVQGIIAKTDLGREGGAYLDGMGVRLCNRTEMALDQEILGEGQVRVELGAGPHILIVHTHGSEAYAQTDGNTYQESDPYRTTDCTRNIVRVGEEMASVFRANGLEVIHDTNLYDYPAYNGSYDRSKIAVERWLEKYPTIQVVLDVHRDALVGADGEIYKLVEGTGNAAQVMFVLGSNDAGLEHPGWRDNLALAVRLQQGILRDAGDLARPMVLRSHRYNQQLLPGALLVEVGGHGNSLSEAISGARQWADSVARTLREYQKDGVS